MCPSPSHTQQANLVTKKDISEREESGALGPEWHLWLERVEEWTLETREAGRKLCVEQRLGLWGKLQTSHSLMVGGIEQASSAVVRWGHCYGSEGQTWIIE